MEDQKKSWWSRRTGLEKNLTVISILITLVSIGLLVGLIVVAVNNGSDEEHHHEVCFNSSCLMESSKILLNMNLTADPCDDFYEFACGSFMKNTVIPDDRTQITSFSQIDTQMREQLREIVSEPIIAGEIVPFQNVKKLYQACSNTALIDQLGTAPVLNALNSMGGWPVVNTAWNENAWTWQGSVASSRQFGYSVSYLLSFSVSTDNRDSTKRVIRIDHPSLGLSREYLIMKFEEPFVAAYRDYQVDLAVLFGANRATAVTEMGQVLEFEFELAEISMAREERRDAEALYNPRTVAEIQTAYNYVGHNWLTFFNSILPAESQLLSSDTVIVAALPFFEKLGDLLARTPKRVLANYVMWRQAVSSVNYLPTEFLDRQQEYVRLTTGRATQDPRWLQCVETTLSYFPHAFGALYVRKHFKEEAKAKVVELVTNIKKEFKEILKDIDWMDNVTKDAADIKADKITEQMGFADELMDDAKIVEYYNTFGATIVETQYYQSVYNWNIASSLRSNRRLREPIDKDDWTSQVTPAIVNAFYSSLENSIKFPAGILQGAFFNADRPQYMNYGGIGYVIGHEITHGFDDQGSQYDADGNLRNWWADATRAAYLERAQCIIDQYGRFVEPLTGLNLNGINTQGENIADNGGIKQSYLAYVRWAKDHPEPRLPGLDFTPQQMFWVSAGQIWCSVYREEAMKSRVTTGVHSPGQFRVIGPMGNTKEFADDFQCASGTTMNPTSKCAVW